ncbi:hypothetical protein C8R43DRAFT_1244882 [Mycena crocata]|nr:hypothetical protein C8R43DRAFT_1244882 [Mycena crocata]
MIAASTRISPSPAPPPSRLRTRLKEIDEEMDALESKLRLLTVERRSVMEHLDSIIYPILTLPPEITSQIFSHCVDKPHIGRPPGDRPYPERGPLVLASVCRSWRDICIALRALWSSLAVYPDRHSSIDNLLRLLKLWLTRSGTHQLDLHIGAFSSHMFGIFDVISQYSLQWRSLDITLDTPYDFPIQSRVPQLTKLVVYIMGNGDFSPMTGSAFRDAPRLREVQLSRASLKRISLPWNQLTHLDFSDETVFSCMLESFLIATYHSSPRLHTLSFRYDRDGMLFDYLTLPVLKHIDLAYVEDEGASRLQGLARRGWSLHTMRLTGVASSAILTCLRCVSSLEQVEIYNPREQMDGYTAPLVEHLSSDDTFLPRLLRLTLEEYDPEISESSLLEMLTSRRNGSRDAVAKLQYFCLLLCDDARKDASAIETQLRSLRVADFDIEIGCR